MGWSGNLDSSMEIRGSNPGPDSNVSLEIVICGYMLTCLYSPYLYLFVFYLFIFNIWNKFGKQSMQKRLLNYIISGFLALCVPFSMLCRTGCDSGRFSHGRG